MCVCACYLIALDGGAGNRGRWKLCMRHRGSSLWEGKHASYIIIKLELCLGDFFLLFSLSLCLSVPTGNIIRKINNSGLTGQEDLAR